MCLALFQNRYVQSFNPQNNLRGKYHIYVQWMDKEAGITCPHSHRRDQTKQFGSRASKNTDYRKQG